MTSEDPTFLKLMRSFKRELRRNIYAPILPTEEEYIAGFNELLREISQPIQENRVVSLLKAFLTILETNQDELDTQMDEEDDSFVAALQREWDRLDRIAAKVEKFLDSIPPSTPAKTTE
jgi:predicted Rossmann fold nucleotide-binding protein DprA/Smf involved in DNA uptake